MADGLGMYGVEIKSLRADHGSTWKCVATSSTGAKAVTSCLVSVSCNDNYNYYNIITYSHLCIRLDRLIIIFTFLVSLSITIPRVLLNLCKSLCKTFSLTYCVSSFYLHLIRLSPRLFHRFNFFWHDRHFLCDFSINLRGYFWTIVFRSFLIIQITAIVKTKCRDYFSHWPSVSIV